MNTRDFHPRPWYLRKTLLFMPSVGNGAVYYAKTRFIPASVYFVPLQEGCGEVRFIDK